MLKPSRKKISSSGIPVNFEGLESELYHHYNEPYFILCEAQAKVNYMWDKHSNRG